uniref:Uncharacterized protein n=1 Tax=Amphimedon queenslandica TaxID=400682 RepID=A0A1X7VY25_AMPQE
MICSVTAFNYKQDNFNFMLQRFLSDEENLRQQDLHVALLAHTCKSYCT